MPRTPTINPQGNVEWTETASSLDGDNLVITLELDAVDSGSGFVQQDTDSSNVSWLDLTTSSVINSDGSRDVTATLEVDPNGVSAGSDYRFEIKADDGKETSTRILVLQVFQAVSSISNLLIKRGQQGLQSGQVDEYDINDGTSQTQPLYNPGGETAIYSPKASNNWIITVGDQPFSIERRDENNNRVWQTNGLSGGNPTSMVYNPNNGFLYVTERRNSNIYKINWMNGNINDSNTVGRRPSVIRLIPDGSNDMVYRDTDDFHLIDENMNIQQTGAPFPSGFGDPWEPFFGFGVDSNRNIYYAQSDTDDASNGIYQTDLNDLSTNNWSARQGIGRMYNCQVQESENRVISMRRDSTVYINALDGSDIATITDLQNNDQTNEFANAYGRKIHTFENGEFYCGHLSTHGLFNSDGSINWSENAHNGSFVPAPLETD